MDETTTKSSVVSDKSECSGSAVDYKAVAEWLYAVIDDIDTLSDAAKGDDSSYRRNAERLQKLKEEVGCSFDGQTVTFRNPQQDYGLTRIYNDQKATPWPND